MTDVQAAESVKAPQEMDYLEAICDEDQLRQMWQSESDQSEKRRIRARMYRLREEQLREMVQNDEESMGALLTKEEEIRSASRRTSRVEVQLNSSGEIVSETETTEIIMGDKVVKSLLKDKLNAESDLENLISMNLSGEGYSSMRNKETRDSVSPSRFGQDVEIVETIEDREQEERLLEALRKAGKTVKVIKSEKIIKSEIPIRSDRTRSPHQSPHGSPYASPYGSPRLAKKQMNLSPTRLSKPKSTTRGDAKSQEFGKLSSYLEDKTKGVGILVNEEEEEMFDESGNKVEMLVTTHKDCDGKEFTTRRTARMTKVVDNVEDIDEILIGNPDHEVLERDVQEEEGEDGSMIKIITETRKRPDGVEYTTKNVLRTEKIIDCDNPEDVEYCENDFLVSTAESEETDENGMTTRVVTETRRKENGQEYVSKNIYKKSRPVPCEDDEILKTQEKEERDLEGNTTRVVIETRRTKSGEEYMHKQTFKNRRMTLSGVALEKGMPMMGNDDEVLNRQEKKQIDEDGSEITVVTETRRKEDGKKYTFDYILRSFKGSQADVKSMPMKTAGATNIKVSDDDELIREEVTEKEQEDGTTVKTIIERRRAKDGTEYLRHKIMRIPKIAEAKLTVGTFNDEVLENDIEESEYNGTKIKSITERRRSSLTGLQYTLRRMSKSYHRNRRPSTIPGDDLIDENVTEENGEEGTTIKTIIRRYQRRDGTMYTTHNVNKCFTAPTEVVVEDDGDLVDQSMNQQEIEDGIIQRTVTETFERIDGTQYTFERSEKISKESASVIDATDYTNKDVQMIVPSTEDVVLSQNVEEQPDDGGLIIRITEEERRRTDGSKYSTKITSQIIPDIVPDQETSYVIIKPEDGQEDSDILPSLQDKLVYTRKKEEIDEDGNAITVVIETRESKDTGEKYNLTKRLFTADVLVTEEGEKVLDKAVVKSIDRKMNAVRKTEVNTAVNTEDRSTTSINTCNVHISSNQNIISDKSVQDVKTVMSVPKKLEVKSVATTVPKVSSPSASSPSTRTSTPTRSRRDDVSKKTTPIKPSNSGRTISSKPASPTKTSAPSTPTTPKAFTTKKDVVPRTPSARTTAADRRTPTTPTTTSVRTTRTTVKETTTVTPKRQTPIKRKPVAETKPAEVTPTRKPATTRTPSRDQILEKRRGSLNRTPNKSQPQGTDSASYTKTRGPRPTPEKSAPIKKQSPRERPTDILKGSRRRCSKDLKTKPEDETDFSDTTDPRISYPPTPMTEDMKTGPVYQPSEVEPTIEDVSNDPNLPRHKIHRPSIVREPSKDFGEKLDIEAIEAQIIVDTDKSSDEVSEIEVSETSHKKKNITDRFGKFDEKKEINKRRVSIDTTLDSVSSKRSMFENGGARLNKKSDVKTTLNTNRQTNGLSPVVEPAIVPKHFRPLGKEDEPRENIKSPLKESPEMESPKLIMRLTSQDKENASVESSIEIKTKKTSSASISDTRRSSIMTDDESRSDFSKEGSPSRFVTGKPIDNGANTNKIKKIERTLSGKIDFDQLDAARNNLPEYLKTIETITDVTILQTMLDKAESYEERRVIRGQIRVAKRTSVTTTTKNTYGRSVLDQKSRTASRVDRTQVNAAKTIDSPLRTRKDKSASPERKTDSPIPSRSSSRKNSDAAVPNRKVSADLNKEEIIDENEPIADTKSTKSYSSRKMSTDEITSSKSTAMEITSKRKTSITKSTVSEVRSARKTSTTETTIDSKSIETKSNKSSARKTSDKTVSARRTSVDKTNASTTKPRTVVKRDSRDDLKTTSEKTTPKTTRNFNIKPATPSYKRPTKGASDVVSSPLRHQKGAPTPSGPQTDVEKIISPYGCGVTDENGLPLFGLKALKRRNQQAKTAPASEPVQKAPEAEKPKEIDLKDASGRSMFGLKAVQKTSITETVRKASITSMTSDRKASKNEKDHDSSSSSSSSSSDSSSDEEDTNKTNGEVIKKEEVIRTRSQPLRDILLLHEKKVQEPVETEKEPIAEKPKQKLRGSFEPEFETTELKTTKTWDVDSDLSTRAINIKNVMAKHEHISKDMKEEGKDAKKPVGILKKSSSTSQSHVSAATVDTSEFMDDMTEDQLAKLSDEFDRRTQEDGVIIPSRGSTPDRENLAKGHRRKTSYSEITLASTGGDGSSSHRVEQTSRFSSTTTRGIGSTNGSTRTTTRGIGSTNGSTIRLNGTTNGSSATDSTNITTGFVNITANGSAGVTVEHTKGSFLQDKSKVTGFGDVMSRMGATEAVEGKVENEEQARSLLNRFLGAQVMMTGVESMLGNQGGGSTGNVSLSSMRSCEIATTNDKEQKSDSADQVKGVDISREFSEEKLRKLLDSCDSYEDRRKIRLRLKNIAAKAKGGAVGAETSGVRGSPSGSLCSLRSDAGPAALKNAPTTTSTISTSSTTKTKGSGWAKFQQMDQQQTTTTRRASPFMMTLPVIRHNACQVKQIILDFVKRNTAEYESKGVKVENFSSSWSDGLAFCALIHHFFPDAFDFDSLDAKNRRYNFDLAFRTADERANVMALLDVEDMVIMKKPDWKSVFTYVQSLYRHLKDL